MQDIQADKLELVRLILDETDITVLRKLKELLRPNGPTGWEMSDELYAELQERSRLREEGEMETYSWEEVREELMNRFEK